MSRILFGVSPVGLGHATRAMVVRAELERRGVEVKMFSGGRAAEFLRSAGVQVEDIVEDPGLPVVNGEMKRASLWYVRSWLANRRTLKRTERLFDNTPHDLVVCDEEFSGIMAAERRGERRVFISDELELGFARSWLARKLERRVEGWYRRLQGTVDLLIVPELGEDRGNRRYVGPIVRAPTMPCEETRRKHGIPGGPFILFSASGSGAGMELALRLAGIRDEAAPGVPLVISGNRGDKVSGGGVYDLGVVPDNQNLVACADLVVSTAGKSTIDEASAAGTPMIAIPIRHHAEQERNALALGYRSDDSRRLAELVREKLGRRENPRAYSGEKRAAELVTSLLVSRRQ